MLCLQIVHGFLTILCSLLVRIVETVPINLSVRLACLPVIHCVIPTLPVVGVVAVLEVAPYIEVSRWHVLPVVWLWVLGVVVVELSTLIHRILAKQRRSELHLVIDVPVPCSDGRRCKVVHYA